MYSLILLGALASSVLGQAITYANTSFTAPVTVGATWPISFSEGTGDDVAIAFGNSSYSFQVVEGLTAPGMYPWQAAVPVNVVSGLYQLALLQGDEDPVFSPAFQLNIPSDLSSQTTDAPTTAVAFPTITTTATDLATTTATTTVTAIYLPGPTGWTQANSNGTWWNGTMPDMPPVTYIYWEESCGCHQTSSCDYTALLTSMSTTTVTYHDEDCGCTKTVAAPCAETAIPMPMPMNASPAAPAPAPAPMSSASMSSMSMSSMPAAPAATTTPAAPMATTPAAYTGGAGRVVAGSLGFIALVGALVLV